MLKELDLLEGENTITITREYKPLTYEIVEGNLKHLQGQILTVIEATVNIDKQTAVKSLIKGFVNDKLTFLFDYYGYDTEQEMPNYDKE